jgi:hypothetical protein
MEAASCCAGVRRNRYSVQQEGCWQKAPIIRSKNILKCYQERFEKYCGSTLMLSILNTEISSA